MFVFVKSSKHFEGVESSFTRLERAVVCVLNFSSDKFEELFQAEVAYSASIFVSLVQEETLLAMHCKGCSYYAFSKSSAKHDVVEAFFIQVKTIIFLLWLQSFLLGNFLFFYNSLLDYLFRLLLLVVL